MSIKINGVTQDSTINENSVLSHGTYHLADNPELFEPARSNTYEFIIDIGSILKSNASINAAYLSAYTGDNTLELLRLSTTSAAIPHFSQDVISIRRGNNTLKYAGVPTFDAGQIVFNDYIGADTKSILMAWQNQSYNVRTEKVGHMSDYKHDCSLIELTPDLQVVRTWIYKGCWISNISEPDFNSESGNENRKITITLQYDKAYLDDDTDNRI